jgi:hypothetical protein
VGEIVQRSAEHASSISILEPKWRLRTRRDRAYADSNDHLIRWSAKLDPGSCDLDLVNTECVDQRASARDLDI